MGTINLNKEVSVLKGYNMLLYFAGSMIMYEPDEECITDFWSKGILKAMPVKSNNPRFIKAASQLRESCTDKATCRERLRKDFNRLFTAGGNALAPPVKSHYSFEQKGESIKTEDVTHFYESYGWKKRTRYNIPDDNLGIELLFLTLLIDKHVSLEDDACRNEMRMEIRRFIWNHLLSWLPDWNIKMQEHAETLCYKGISTLVYAICEDIHGLLDQPDNNLPRHYNN